MDFPGTDGIHLQRFPVNEETPVLHHRSVHHQPVFRAERRVLGPEISPPDQLVIAEHLPIGPRDDRDRFFRLLAPPQVEDPHDARRIRFHDVVRKRNTETREIGVIDRFVEAVREAEERVF